MNKIFDISHYLKSPIVGLQAKVFLLHKKLSGDEITSINLKISELIYRIELFEDFLSLQSSKSIPTQKFELSNTMTEIIRQWNLEHELKINFLHKDDAYVNLDLVRFKLAIWGVLRWQSLNNDIKLLKLSLENKSGKAFIKFENVKESGAKFDEYIETVYLKLLLKHLSGGIVSNSVFWLPITI